MKEACIINQASKKLTVSGYHVASTTTIIFVLLLWLLQNIMMICIFCIFQVTWIRHRDVHILTVGEYTYTTDQRFLARHNQNTDEWTLVIKYVQERDAGIYECQIPSRIPRSYPINLNIVGKCTTTRREKLLINLKALSLT